MELNMERYNKELEAHENDKEWVDELVKEWGIKAFNNGYEIFDFNGYGLLQIEAIGDLSRFDGDSPDNEAAIQAEKDGIKIIPVDELPNPFIVDDYDRRYFGWIDTPENRKAINEWRD